MTSYDAPRMPRRNRKQDDPKTIGLWKIGRTIGHGASGRVRIARHSKTGVYAAVKIISKTTLVNSRTCMTPDAEEQADKVLLNIEREIVILKLVDHENVNRLLDVWETSTELYLILEYAEGGELFDYLSAKLRLSTSEARSYFRQIMSAVGYCHRFNIAHRDLKPENILLDKEKKVVKVADFGMAAWQPNARGGLLQTACGSPHYAAPEVLVGLPYDGSAADIWSCGVILFALLTGRLPFDDDEQETQHQKVIAGKYEYPTDVKVDAQAKDLIGRMLQRDIQKRITVQQILGHPFVTADAPKSRSADLQTLDDIAPPLGRIADIDPDIFANLRTLWHGVPDSQLERALQTNERTLEKGVYHLLLQHRARQLEDYSAEDRPRTPLSRPRDKKTKACADVQRFYHKHGTSMDQSRGSPPPRCDPPTPRRAKRNRNDVDAAQEDSDRLPQITLRSPTIFPSAEQSHDQQTPASFQLPLSFMSTPSNHSPATVLSPQSIMSPLSMLSPRSSNWEVLGSPPDLSEVQDERILRYIDQLTEYVNVMHIQSASSGQSTLVNPSTIPRGTYSPGSISIASPPTPSPLGAANFLLNPRMQHSKDRDFDPPPTSDSFGLGISDTTMPLNVSKISQPYPLGHFLRQRTEKGSANTQFRGGGPRVVHKSSLRRSTEDERVSGRHVQIIEPEERERILKRRSLAGAFTPELSSTPEAAVLSPRSSWFNNLGIFKFRPAAYQLLSAHDAGTTREECRRLLVGLGARVVLTHAEDLGVLMCRLDHLRDAKGFLGSVKAVRFRVEVRLPSLEAEDRGFETMLQFVQEKGAVSSFRALCGRLRGDWELDEQVPRASDGTDGDMLDGESYLQFAHDA